MRRRIDINCDLGESYGAFKVGNDARIMPYITSANIACGLHAGDPMTAAETIALAKRHNVAVGAHPGFPDLLGFGRREMQLLPEEVQNYTLYQVSALQGFAQITGDRLQHVKPHGALYNMAVDKEKVAKPIVDAVKALDSSLIVFAPPSSALATVAAKAGLRVGYEFFADRAYNSDGTLVSRKLPDSVIEEPLQVVERVVKAVIEGTVLTSNQEVVNLGKVHTICIHGDNPAAVTLAEALCRGLDKAGIEIRPIGTFL